MTNLTHKKLLFGAWSCHNHSYHAHQMWDAPLRKLFGKVVSFDPQEVLYSQGKEDMNRLFLEMVKKEQPDYLFLWLIGEEFYLETLAQIRILSPQTIIVNFCGDDDTIFSTYVRYLFPFIDYFFVTQAQFIPAYKGRAFFSCGANTSAFVPQKRSYQYDVSFIGTPKADRAEYIRYLLKNGISVALFGGGWEAYPEFKDIYKGKVTHEEFVEIINSTKINLSLCKNYENGPHVLERFFEVNSCKAFGLTEFSPGYVSAGFREGKDMISFTSPEELLKKIDYYLTHEKERKQIAQRAYTKTIRSFSIDTLLRKGFETMERRKRKNKKIQTSIPLVENVDYLSPDDLFLSPQALAQKIGNATNIGFTRKSVILPYKNMLQTYGMHVHQKPISCCNSYYHSSLIDSYASGNLKYMKVINDETTFQELFDITQLCVEKNYLLSHLEAFRKLVQGKGTSFLTFENTAFLSYPFVQITKQPKLPSSLLSTALTLHFENVLRMLKKQKRLFTSPYTYRLVLYALLFDQELLRYLRRQFLAKRRLL